MASLPPSSNRYWHFWLATSPPGSHEGVVLHLCDPQRDPHTGWTLRADATTPASVVLRAPLAHRRVGEVRALRLLQLLSSRTRCAGLRELLNVRCRRLVLNHFRYHANRMLYSAIPSPAPNGNQLCGYDEGLRP